MSIHHRLRINLILELVVICFRRNIITYFTINYINKYSSQDPNQLPLALRVVSMSGRFRFSKNYKICTSSRAFVIILLFDVKLRETQKIEICAFLHICHRGC